MRKTVQAMVIFTILAWATQTLLHQWGYGAERPTTAPAAMLAGWIQGPFDRQTTSPDSDEAAPTTRPSFIVKPGQFLTVTMTFGQARLRTVLRAMEEGSAGSIIHARNEGTNQVYPITITGPTEGECDGSVAVLDWR
jgi:hypothetical protein